VCKPLIYKSYNFQSVWRNTSVVIIIAFGLFRTVHCFGNVDSFDFNTNSTLLFLVTRKLSLFALESRKLFETNYTLLVGFLLRTVYFVHFKFCVVRNVFVPTIIYHLHSLYGITVHHPSPSSLLIKLNKQLFQVVCPFLSGATQSP